MKVKESFLCSVLQNKVDAGQSSISILNDVTEIEKVLQRSRKKMAYSLQIQE